MKIIGLLTKRIKNFFKIFLASVILFVVSLIVVTLFAGNKKPQPHTVISETISTDDKTDSPLESAKEAINAKVFTPRLTCPEDSNKFYFSNNNFLYKSGYGMPNCTAYAFGRAYEILGYEPEFSINDAATWWKYNIKYNCYPYGSEPKLGAIAVWEYDGTNNGHVAVVEKIENGIVTLSMSAWEGEMFFLRKAQADDTHMGYKNWNFLGFIYII